MSVFFRKFLANQSPFDLKSSKRLTGLAVCLALGLWLCSAFAVPQAQAGQTITINGNVIYEVHGNGDPPNGFGSDRDPNNNTVIVNSGTLTGGVIGGAVDTSSSTNAANSNSVTINNGTIGPISGGSASTNGSATANSNSVTIDNGSINSIQGGVASSTNGPATASDNRVTINGGTFDTAAYVIGGIAFSTADDQATASGNRVTIKDITTERHIHGGEAHSSGGAGTASGNIVTLTNVTAGQVAGGNVSTAAGSATASNNHVTINGGSVFYVRGGSADTVTGTATASGNSVTMSGGTVRTSIYGGYVSGPGTASGNSVTISGGTVRNDVYGGYVSGLGTASGNSVTISGSPSFGTITALYGGFTPSAGDAFTGNTLNLRTPVSVFRVQNFEHYNFHLPTTLGAGETMLTITSGGQAVLTEKADGTGRSSIVNVGISGAATTLKPGDQVILIDASNAGTLVTGNHNATSKGEGMQGVTLKYKFNLEAVDKRLIATVAEVEAEESDKAFSEGFLAGLALVNQVGDLIAGRGVAEAVAAARGASSGLASFGAMSGGWSSYKTGSSLDMASLSLLAGLATGWDLDPGRLTLGAFLDFGTGSYDTYNSFGNSRVHGRGDTYHLGGGYLGRLDFADKGGLYAEGSVRGGGVHNANRNDDLRDDSGRLAEYDSDSGYYGFHLGSGYIWNINEKAALDLYGKYFWTRLEGDSVTLSTGDPVNFEAAESSRLRLGSRLAYAMNEHVSPYVGAAYEHEFEGQSKATTNGYAIEPPSLRGGTAVGEFGVSYKPTPTGGLSFELGVQGYTGQRQGVSESLQVKWEF